MTGKSPRRTFTWYAIWSRRSYLLITTAAAAVTILVLLLLINISQRKAEALNPFFRVVALDDTVDDPKVWGQNFPLLRVWCRHDEGRSVRRIPPGLPCYAHSAKW